MVNSNLNPDLVLIMPVNAPPHKSGENLIDTDHRVKMLEAAFKDFGNVKICDLELKRDGKSYTIDTLEDLTREYPNSNLFLICGGDMINTLHTWHRFEKILTLANIIAIPRHNEDVGEFEAAIKDIEKVGCKVIKLHNLPPNISSTKIRENIENRESIENLVPKAVNEYIAENNLYSKDIYVEFIEKNLSEKRVKHCKAVAKAALELAKKQNLGEKQKVKIYVAAILHDILKEKTYEELLLFAAKNGIMLDGSVKNEYKLLHAPLGAHLAKTKFNLDEETANAIKYHTTGRANATILDKILFIADFISDDRDFDPVDNLRKAAQIDLNYCLVKCLQFTIDDLKNRELSIHPDTIAAYNEAILKNKEN